MAGSFTPTGTYSNLSRLEMEQLRKADLTAGGKALTVGDAGNVAGGVGPGSITAENYATGPSLVLRDVNSITPPVSPGKGLGIITQVAYDVDQYPAVNSSNTVTWFGPQVVLSSNGYAVSGTVFEENEGVNLVTAGVQVGDILVLLNNASGGGDQNDYARGTITVVTSTQLTVNQISCPLGASPTAFDFGGSVFPYRILRPTVMKLFAVPGSGPLGREQTFMTVAGDSTLHTSLAPTVAQINTDRIKNLVPPEYNTSPSVDRADAVYSGVSGAASLDRLGYRMVLYRSLANGLGPDLTAPIATITPSIDPAIPAADQRMTIDYKAGIVRFSCAPSNTANGVITPDIKPAGGNGGVNTTTGRLELYAVFWAFDLQVGKNSANNLYVNRSLETEERSPARLTFDVGDNQWGLGSNGDGSNNFIVRARDADDNDGVDEASFGGISNNVLYGFQVNITTGKITYTPTSVVDVPVKMELAPKTNLSVGTASPLLANPGADYNPTPNGLYGLQNVTTPLQQALWEASVSDYPVVELRRGRYQLTSAITIPPGVTLRGVGSSTVLKSFVATASGEHGLIKFGTNNRWGTYDFNVSNPGTAFIPSQIETYSSRIEGLDMVWNPVRQVWGVVWADSSANLIYFREMDLRGNLTDQLNVKDNGNLLYTHLNNQGEHHTTGHYPRIDHHANTDTYVFVWVEQVTISVIGPRVRMSAIQYQNGVLYGTINSIAISGLDAANFTDHPSIAVNQAGSGTFQVAVSSWKHSVDLATSRVQFSIVSVNTVASTLSAETTPGSGPANEVGPAIISSTDVIWDGRTGFVVAYSIRKHKILFGSSGTIVTASGLYTDNTVSAANWGLLGIEVGSRVICTGNTVAAERGLTAHVRAIHATTGVYLNLDGGQSPATFSNNTNTFTGYIAPVSRIKMFSYDSGTNAFIGNVIQIAGPITTPVTSNYNTTEREPDFVRLGRAGDSGRIVAVYQNFDTNGAMNRVSTTNWDNGVDSTLFPVDSGAMVLSSPRAHREHLSTSFVLVDVQHATYAGLGATSPVLWVVGPSVTQTTHLTTDPSTLYHQARDYEVIGRSLGNKYLFQPYQNFSKINTRFDWEVSYRNHSMQIDSNGRYPSMIPDLTWNGQDWTIVSPPPTSTIFSDTGTVKQVSSVWYLTDPSFYFGAGVASPDGIYQKTHLEAGDKIFFPDVTQFGTVAAGHDEHTISLTGAVAGITNGTTNVKWVLCRKQSSTTPASLNGYAKNAGFRLTQDGQVLVTSGGLTFADEPLESATASNTGSTAWPMETINRSQVLWGNINFTSQAAKVAGSGMNHLTYNDLLEGSRLKADLAWKGVAVGWPKGFNQDSRTECPNVAIAWGEDFYAFADRVTSGVTSGPTPVQTTINVHRQSFGPYRSEVKDLRLEGGSNSLGFRLMSKALVFTRHGPPVTGNPNFATDGYRNLFLHWAAGGFTNINTAGSISTTPYLDPRDPRHHSKMFANCIVTDATGRDPIRSRVGSAETVPATFGVYDNNSGGGAFVNQNTSKTIWTGKEFFSAIVENDQIKVYRWSGDDHNKTSILMGDELTGDSYWDHGRRVYLNLANAVAQFYAGSGDVGFQSGYGVESYNGSAPVPLDISQIDLAWTGTSLAIMWTAGHNMVLNNDITGGGAVCGVTVIHPGHFGYTGMGDGEYPRPITTPTVNAGWERSPTNYNYSLNATTFILDQQVGTGANKATIRDARILWDGSNFVMAYVRLNQGTYNLRFVTMPEAGPTGGGAKLKRLGNGDFYGQIGRLTGDGGINLNFGEYGSDGTTGNQSENAPAVGDVIHITDSTNANGYYTINSINYRTGRAFLGVSIPGAALTAVHGAIWSNAAGTSTGFVNATGAIEQADGEVRKVTTGPNLSASTPFSPFGAITGDKARIYAMFYREDSNSYVIFTGKNANPQGIYMSEISRGSLVTKELTIASTGSPDVSVGFNGQDFFIVVLSQSADPTYTIVSKDLVRKVSAVALDNTTNIVGSNEWQIPGPGYQNVSNFSNPTRVFTGSCVVWNERLGRWIVTLSSTAHDLALRGSLGEVLPGYGYNYTATRPGPVVSAWSNRIGTFSLDLNWNPGHRWLVTRYTELDFFPVSPITSLTVDSWAPNTPNVSLTQGPTANNGTYRSGTVINSRQSVFTPNVAGAYISLKAASHSNGNIVRRLIVSATSDVNATDHVYTEGAMSPNIPVADTITFRSFSIQSLGLVHLVAQPSTTTLKFDQQFSDVASSANYVSAGAASPMAVWSPLSREDVYMFTFGYDSTPVEVANADSVSMTDVEINGAYVDVSEHMRKFSRPYYKVGGMTFGSPNDPGLVATSSLTVTNARQHVYPVYPTPMGTLDTIRLSGVKSLSAVKYASISPEAGLAFGDRRLINTRNRKG